MDSYTKSCDKITRILRIKGATGITFI